jgi:hypothetical protein
MSGRELHIMTRYCFTTSHYPIPSTNVTNLDDRTGETSPLKKM